MPGKQLKWRVSPDVHAILEDVQANVGPGAGALIEQLVTDYDRAWKGALARLTLEHGWQPAELCAAADALNGTWLLDRDAPPFLALELRDAESLNGTARKWDVEPARWAELVRQVAEVEGVGEDLRTLVDAFWRGPGEVARRLGG